MNIAIIGAGFTGLSAGYELVKQGHNVTIFEKDPQPGGLAIGYQEKGWEWTLEKHYHHWFTNDSHILELAKELNYEVIVKRPHTNWFVNGKIYEFDSISAALTFPLLSPIERVRNLATLGLLRFNPFWFPLERVHAKKALPILMGRNAYKMLWEPLFSNKFGSYADEVSLAWFWARIAKRTPSLAYPAGGFLQFAETLANEIKKRGGTVSFNTETVEIRDNNKIAIQVKTAAGKLETNSFDKVIVTLPSQLFLKITPQLPKKYTDKLVRLKGLGAINLILRLNKPFFTDNTYWLSIADTSSPIMAIVEHTNFMDKKHYNNEHLVYLGNYLPTDHPNFSKTAEELLNLYDSFLRKINKDYQKTIIGYQVFKASFAQPIIPVNYSKLLPPMKTPLPNVFLANIQQVYPWDRGTTYAVELGQKAAELILSS